MIAHVIGTVAEKFNGSLIVDVNGVGYEVAVALGEFESASLDENIKLYTYHHIREQSQELFGFSSLAAKKLFELLITVQGVGPKAALAILSLGDGENVRNAIANSDSAFIQKATGVGKKTAERLLVELKDRFKAWETSPLMAGLVVEPRAAQVVSSAESDALSALLALGYKPQEASKAVAAVKAEGLSSEEMIRRALKGMVQG